MGDELVGWGIYNLGGVFYNLLCGGLNGGREVGIMGVDEERTDDSSKKRSSKKRSRNNSRKRVVGDTLSGKKCVERV